MFKNLLEKCRVQKRHVIAFMIFIGYSNITFLHANLSMAVVEMTALKNVSTPDGNFRWKAEFNWTSQQKALILSSYSYGRLLSPLAGILAGKLGGSTIYSIGNLVMAIITFCSPFILFENITLFFIVYVIFGGFEAFLISGALQIISRWVPPSERARFISFGAIGIYFGSVVSFVVSGWVLKQFSWQVLFYGSGVVSFVWFWIWFIVVKNDPSEDKNLSEIELKYIQDTVKCTYIGEKLVYPWRSILTLKSLWIAALSQFTITCGYIFTAVYLPQYIKDTKNINIAQVGITSAIPQICAMVSMPLSGIVGDYVRSREWMSITNVHKLFAGISLFIAAICYTVVILWPNFELDITAIALFQFFSTLYCVNLMVLFLDISPKYSAFLMSIGNMVSISAGFIVPAIVGNIVTTHSLSEWNRCFTIFSVMYVCAAVFYLKFVSAEQPSWANYHHDSSDEITQSRL